MNDSIKPSDIDQPLPPNDASLEDYDLPVSGDNPDVTATEQMDFLEDDALPVSASEQKALDKALSEVDKIKVLPYSIEAEQAVLGGLMLSNTAYDDVIERVSEIDFYLREHRLIFNAIAKLGDQGNPFDLVTISETLNKVDFLEACGGVPYLAELSQNTPSAANIISYANIVRERSLRRQMIEAAEQISKDAFTPKGQDAKNLLDKAEQRIFGIAEQTQSQQQGPQDVRTILKSTVERINELHQSGDALVGMPSGFTDLDGRTNGLQAGALVIVAARPAMGKTTFSMNIAENTLMQTQKPVLVFSMEMPAEQIMMRMLASLSRVELGKVTTGNLSSEDWPRITSAIQMLSEQKFYVDDSAGLTPSDVRARARRVAKEHGEIGLILVDYLQLMRVEGMQNNRVAEISEISRSLKALAKELSCPVVALSQLNRSLEQRPNKRPVMSDLRESGAIEQDADIIMFIYRDEVYNEDTPDKGMAEIIIGKQRNGPIGTVRLAFLGRYTRFEDLSPETYQSFNSE